MIRCLVKKKFVIAGGGGVSPGSASAEPQLTGCVVAPAATGRSLRRSGGYAAAMLAVVQPPRYT